MSSQTDRNDNNGRWERFWSRPKSRWLIGMPIGAWFMFAAGAFAMLSFEVVMYQTSTEKFCTTACHSMATFTAPEWRDSIHYSNRSGVKATCSDCHIPKVYPQSLWAKAYDGGRHMIAEILGTIDTQEKYEARRVLMAEYVWRNMKKNDSRECRNCHDPQFMELASQNQRAARAHQQGSQQGQTCINCHKGIAHKTPDEVVNELAKVSSSVK